VPTCRICSVLDNSSTSPPDWPLMLLLMLLLHAKRCFNIKLVESFGFWLRCVPTFYTMQLYTRRLSFGRSLRFAKVKQIQIACHVLIWSTNDRIFKLIHILTHTDTNMYIYTHIFLRMWKHCCRHTH